MKCYVPAALILLAASSLRADWLMDEANKNLLASSTSVRALVDEIHTACPRFTLSFSRDAIPGLFQLRVTNSSNYVGVVNMERVRKEKGIPEIAVAGIYYSACREVTHGNKCPASGTLEFLEKVRKELAKADPVRYGHLKSLTPTSPYKK